MPPHSMRTPGPLSPALWELSQKAEVRKYRKGMLLLQEGDTGDSLYLVLSGRLRMFCLSDNGKELTYDIYGPGDYFGEDLLLNLPRPASVITLEESTCAIVPRSILTLALQHQPLLSLEMLERSLLKNRRLLQQMHILALEDVYGRLRALLEATDTSAFASAAGTVLQGMTHREMAQYIGCSREMVSRLLKDLERGGFIQRKGPQLKIMRHLPPRW